MKMIIDLKAEHGNPRNIYGQAKVFQKGKTLYLISYETVIATFTEKQGLKRTWCGYSRTSLAHLNYFTQFLNIDKVNGQKWLDMKVYDSKYKTYNDILKA